MSSLLEVLAWACVGMGAAFTALPLRTLTKKNSWRWTKTVEAWSELRSGLTGVAVGVALLGTRTHGTAYWLMSIPLLTMVTLDLALWIRSRIRRRSGKPPAEALLRPPARHRRPADG
jgi:hypothetical protein